MIDSNPLLRLLEERNISLEQLAGLTGLSITDVQLLSQGRSITKEKLNVLCSILKCQPCDIIEFRRHKETGRWVYISSE